MGRKPRATGRPFTGNWASDSSDNLEGRSQQQQNIERTKQLLDVINNQRLITSKKDLYIDNKRNERCH